MAQSFDMAVLSDLGAQLAAWEDAYVSADFEKYRLAEAWAASEAAKTLATRMHEASAEVIDRPTAWIRRAWQYGRALSRSGGGDTVSADAFALDDQSVIMKYLMGEGPQVRLPADVGLSRYHILVPNWMALETAQGIRPTVAPSRFTSRASASFRDLEKPLVSNRQRRAVGGRGHGRQKYQ